MEKQRDGMKEQCVKKNEKRFDRKRDGQVKK